MKITIKEMNATVKFTYDKSNSNCYVYFEQTSSTAIVDSKEIFLEYIESTLNQPGYEKFEVTRRKWESLRESISNGFLENYRIIDGDIE